MTHSRKTWMLANSTNAFDGFIQVFVNVLKNTQLVFVLPINIDYVKMYLNKNF